MATISINVDSTVATRVSDAFIATYPPPAGTDVSTAAAKLAYVKSLLVRHARDVTQAYEASKAADAARTAQTTQSNTDLATTVA